MAALLTKRRVGGGLTLHPEPRAHVRVHVYPLPLWGPPYLGPFRVDIFQHVLVLTLRRLLSRLLKRRRQLHQMRMFALGVAFRRYTTCAGFIYVWSCAIDQAHHAHAPWPGGLRRGGPSPGRAARQWRRVARLTRAPPPNFRVKAFDASLAHIPPSQIPTTSDGVHCRKEKEKKRPSDRQTRIN